MNNIEKIFSHRLKKQIRHSFKNKYYTNSDIQIQLLFQAELIERNLEHAIKYGTSHTVRFISYPALEFIVINSLTNNLYVVRNRYIVETGLIKAGTSAYGLYFDDTSIKHSNFYNIILHEFMALNDNEFVEFKKWESLKITRLHR